jgi:gliding motility-associated-like protein
LTYTFSPIGPSVGAGGSITGMVNGTSYTLISNNGNCNSSPSVAFSNTAATGTPAIPTTSSTAPTCAADGSSTISNYNASLTYIFNPTGPTLGAGGAISGMVIGTSYTVLASDGTCSSTSSNSFSNQAQLVTPTASITGNLTYCVGSNTVLTASGGSGYLWSNTATTAATTVTQGSYSVTVTNAAGCTASASASVTELSSLNVIISGTLSVCQGQQTTLRATGGNTYVWSNGGLADSITVGTGTYRVTASDAGCTGTASAVVSQFSNTPLNLGNDITVCEDSIFSISAPNQFVSFQWSNGQSSQSIFPQSAGEYILTATDVNGCSASDLINVTIRECPKFQDYNFYIPNAFTPNGDNKNDFFEYYFAGVKFAEIKVYNRWGEKVFETQDPSQFWDGTFKSDKCVAGVYIYEVNLVKLNNQRDIIKGSLTLIR